MTAGDTIEALVSCLCLLRLGGWQSNNCLKTPEHPSQGNLSLSVAFSASGGRVFCFIWLLLSDHFFLTSVFKCFVIFLALVLTVLNILG